MMYLADKGKCDLRYAEHRHHCFWSGDINIAPDAKYREIKSKGSWVLE